MGKFCSPERMPRVTIARHIALPLLAIVATAALGACKGKDEPAAAASSAAPAGKPGVTISEARLVLPAVPGNPGAAYFDLANDSKDTVGVASVAVTGAGKTELHTTDMKAVDHTAAEPRTVEKFAPGGLHVMVFDVSANLKAGDQTELTVTFTDGDKISVNAKIEAMGASAMGGMGEAPKP